MGANDGIKRGDRADTGDLEAQPKEGVGRGGSGEGTGVPSSLGGNKPTTGGPLDSTEEGELEVRDQDDPSLGLGDGPEG